jgi:translocation and assembly module TamB
MNILRFLLSFTYKLLIALPLMALLFVLGTTTGLRLALDQASRATHGAIRYTSVEGRLLGSVVLHQFIYDDANVTVEVAEAQITLALPSLLMRRVRIKQLDAMQARVAVKETPPSDSPPFTHLPFGLIIDQANIEHLQLKATAQSDWLDFNKVELSAAWFDDVMQIENIATEFPDFGRLQAAGVLRFLPDGLHIEKTKIKGPGEFVAGMTLGYDKHFELDTQWKNFQYPFTGTALVRSNAGEAKLAGRWDAYDFWFKGGVQTQGFDAAAQAEGQGSLDALKISKLDAQALNGSIRAKGQVQWLPKLLIEAEGNAEKLNPGLQWKDWPGELNGRFKLSTTLVGDTPQIAFDVGLNDSQLRGYRARAQARGHWRAPQLQLDDAWVMSGESRLHASGQALPPFDLAAQLDSPDLAQLWPALKGKAHLNARLRGPLDALAIALQGEGQQLVYEKFSVQKVGINADLDAHASSKLDVQASGIQADLHMDQLHLQGTGTAAQHALKLRIQSDRGALDTEARGALDLKQSIWNGQITQALLAPRDLKPWTLESSAGLMVSRSDINLQPACWHSDDSRACAQIRRGADKEMGVAFRLDNFALAYFQSFLPKGWQLLGRISGTGDLLTRDLNSMRLDLRSSEGSLIRDHKTVLQFLPGQLTLQPDQTAAVAQLKLPLTIGGVEANARLAPGDDQSARALSGTVRLNVPDLNWLRSLAPEIESIKGQLQGELQLSGTPAAPGFSGAVELLGGHVKLVTPGIELFPLHLKVAGSSDKSLVLKADATSGGGTVQLDGTLDNSQDKLALQLTLKGENFQALNTPEARIWMSPDLQLRMNGRTIQVGGLLKVPKAQITPKNFESGIGPSGDQIIVSSKTKPDEEVEGVWRVSTEVRMELGDDVKFDGFGLKTQLTGSLIATDEPGKPTAGRGEITLKGGRYKAYGQDLDIETGRLLFNGGPIIRPAVELRATRKPTEDITVGVSVRGTLDKPEFKLYSTPTMPQERQLSWLVLGRSLDAQGSSADRSKVSDAALSLGLTGGDYLAQKLGGRLGLDTVSVGAKPGQDTTLAQLTLGKYLSPKLFVSYGVGLFQRGYTFRLQYDIGHGFKVQTETGVESGGDLLYTLER